MSLEKDQASRIWDAFFVLWEQMSLIWALSRFASDPARDQVSLHWDQMSRPGIRCPCDLASD